ncbi:MAG: cytidylate kinase family protein [Spirochaetales bacterium]|nr:cytidylate kinase family protein [Spirochaetales bacterium]
MSNNMKIAISGKSGCGNTTVSKYVAKELGFRHINFTFRDMARERGLKFEEMCALAEKDDQHDKFLDSMLIMLSSKGNCVLGSRLAVWHLKDAALKVYLDGSTEIRSQRIAKREKHSYEQAYAETLVRDKRDHERYMRLYNIDINNYDFVDLIIDTEKGDQMYVAQLIIEAAKKIIGTL